MSCNRTRELIHGYVDGELDLVNSLAVERHMQECEACSDAGRSESELSSTLKQSSLYYAAPDDLKKRIQSSLRNELPYELPAPSFPWRWLTLAASVAIVLLIVLLTLAPRLIGPSTEELLTQQVITDHVRSLQLPSHLADVQSSDQHTVKPWFDGKLNFSPPVKDLANEGYPLYGGRLEYWNNTAVATLVYQRRLHYINLFIWPAERVRLDREVAIQRQGYNIIHWTDEGMNYWCISDLNMVELRGFVRLVQQN